MSQSKIVVAHSFNFELIKAMRATLVAAGVKELKEWNDEAETDHQYIAYILSPTDSSYGETGLQIHNHNCTATNKNTYLLPSEWNKFIEAVTKLDAEAKIPTYSVKEVEDETPIEIAGYVATFNRETNRVHFGCQRVDKATLESLRTILGNGTINAKMTIRGEELDALTVNKLLTRLAAPVKVKTCSVTGYKVGDVITETVLNGRGNDIRRFLRSEGWGYGPRSSSGFVKDRTILDMRVHDGVTIGLVSDTIDVWVDLSTLPKRS